MQLPPANAAMAIGLIRRRGWTPIVAHPDRYRNLDTLAGSPTRPGPPLTMNSPDPKSTAEAMVSGS